MPENGKTPENFKCSCGQIVEPPKISKLYASREGTFHGKIPHACPNCGKVYISNYRGKIEKQEKGLTL